MQWKRSNIETVADAIKFAQDEYDRKNNKKTIVQSRKVPSWVGKDIKEEYLSDSELEELERKLRGEE